MKMLLITSIPTPYRNVFYSVLARSMKQSGDQLMVLFCAENEPNRFWDIDEKQMEFDYSFLSGIHVNFKKLFIHFNKEVLRKTKNFNPDVILYTGPWIMPTVIFSLLHNRMFHKNRKTIFWSEGHDGSILYKKGIIPIFRSGVLNRFDGFAVPNSRSRDYLLNYLRLKPKPVLMLPNTVNGEFYTKPQDWNEDDNIRVKEQYGIAPEKNIAVQISQIEHRKGIFELIEYWNEIPNEVKGNFVFILVGEGSLRLAAQEYCIANHVEDVIITGHKSANEVREILFASNIFILLTKNDPNPLTLIEASFAGLPIITTKFAGNCNEIVIDGKNGYVLEEINYNNFYHAIKKVKELSFQTDVRKFSFENAQKNFDIFMVAENFTSQVKKFISE